MFARHVTSSIPVVALRLPEYYEQVIWFLVEKKQYKICYFNENNSYTINDDSSKEIGIIKNEKTTKGSEIKT